MTETAVCAGAWEPGLPRKDTCWFSVRGVARVFCWDEGGEVGPPCAVVGEDAVCLEARAGVGVAVGRADGGVWYGVVWFEARALGVVVGRADGGVWFEARPLGVEVGWADGGVWFEVGTAVDGDGREVRNEDDGWLEVRSGPSGVVAGGVRGGGELALRLHDGARFDSEMT